MTAFESNRCRSPPPLNLLAAAEQVEAAAAFLPATKHRHARPANYRGSSKNMSFCKRVNWAAASLLVLAAMPNRENSCTIGKKGPGQKKASASARWHLCPLVRGCSPQGARPLPPGRAHP